MFNKYLLKIISFPYLFQFCCNCLSNINYELLEEIVTFSDEDSNLLLVAIYKN